MANIKSAKKRIVTSRKAAALNNDVKASMKTAIKKVEKAINKEEAMAKLPEAIKKIDIAASKGVIKANTRDRYKTRLNKLVNEK